MLNKNQTNSGSFKKGHKTWNKGKKGVYSKETRKRMGESHKGKHLSKETKMKLSIIHKNHPRRRPSKIEIVMPKL